MQNSTDTTHQEILKEIREEQHISPYLNDTEFLNYIKDGIYDIDEFCGTKIDYKQDLKARRLLKNYVLYASYERLAEFKIMYLEEYDELQRKYFIKKANSTSGL